MLLSARVALRKSTKTWIGVFVGALLLGALEEAAGWSGPIGTIATFRCARRQPGVAAKSRKKIGSLIFRGNGMGRQSGEKRRERAPEGCAHGSRWRPAATLSGPGGPDCSPRPLA